MTDMPPAAVRLRPSELPILARGQGASTVRLVSRACGSRALLNGITTIPPGAAIPLHFHNCEESVLVIEGAAVAEVGDEKLPLVSGDVTWIPPDLPHRFLNPSTTDTLRIFWTYADVDATRTLVATGESQTIDAEHRR